MVHAPLLGETFSAILGQGAALDGAPIQVTDRRSLADVIVSTGFPHVRPGIDALVERIRRLVTHCQRAHPRAAAIAAVGSAQQ